MSSTATGAGTLRVSVPADAVVWVNDSKTSSTGANREYVSNGLKSNQNYTYRVKVEYKRDGKTVTESKLASLTAGGEITLDFVTSNEPTPVVAEDKEATKTQLTLKVPADAKVTLAGAVTKRKGAERQYVTTRLADGEAWEDYTVRVDVPNGGKTLTQERVITLRGGEAQELVFTFDELKLASR